MKNTPVLFFFATKNDECELPLQYAVRTNKAKACEFLIESGCHLVVSGRKGNTLLHTAIIQLLLRQKLRTKSKNLAGKTIFQLAEKTNNIGIKDPLIGQKYFQQTQPFFSLIQVVLQKYPQNP